MRGRPRSRIAPLSAALYPRVTPSRRTPNHAHPAPIPARTAPGFLTAKPQSPDCGGAHELSTEELAEFFGLAMLGARARCKDASGWQVYRASRAFPAAFWLSSGVNRWAATAINSAGTRRRSRTANSPRLLRWSARATGPPWGLCGLAVKLREAAEGLNARCEPRFKGGLARKALALGSRSRRRRLGRGSAGVCDHQKKTGETVRGHCRCRVGACSARRSGGGERRNLYATL